MSRRENLKKLKVLGKRSALFAALYHLYKAAAIRGNSPAPKNNT